MMPLRTFVSASLKGALSRCVWNTNVLVSDGHEWSAFDARRRGERESGFTVREWENAALTLEGISADVNLLKKSAEALRC